MSRVYSKTILLVVLLTTALLSAMCTKQEFDNLMGQKDSEIERFTQSYEPEDVSYNNGVWRVNLEGGGGSEIIEKGDSIYFNYVAHLFTGRAGTVFDTNIYEKGEEANLDLEGEYYYPLKSVVGKGKLIEGLERGLIGLSEGSHSLLIFTAKYGFGSVETSIIPKNSSLLYEVWILRVIKN